MIFSTSTTHFLTLCFLLYTLKNCVLKKNEPNISAPFLDLDLSISNGIISSNIYDKRDYFNFDTANYPHLDGEVSRATFYGVYISQRVRFAKACSSVEDFHIRSRTITEKNSLNKDTGITNFAKPSPNSIIEIFRSLVNINVIWKLSCDRVFLIRTFMVTWFANFVRFLDMYILKIFFTSVSNHSSIKKSMTQLYRNALLVWLSIPLQSIAMPFYLVVRRQTGFSTPLYMVMYLKCLKGIICVVKLKVWT